MRPIVVKCQAPTYFFLEKTFVLLLKELLPPSNFIVNCTAEFVEYIKMLKIPHDCILANMDGNSQSHTKPCEGARGGGRPGSGK